jgi:hypothetical protein
MLTDFEKNFNSHYNISISCTIERAVQYPIIALSCGPNSSLLDVQYITWPLNLRRQQTDVMHKKNAHRDCNFSVFLPHHDVMDTHNNVTHLTTVIFVCRLFYVSEGGSHALSVPTNDETPKQIRTESLLNTDR